MPAGQQVALEPALAGVLGQDLHHPAVGRQVLVDGRVASSQVLPVTSSSAFSRFDSVSSGPNTRKLPARRCPPHHVAQHRAEHPGRLRHPRPGRGHRHRVVAEVGHRQVAQQQPAVGVRVRAQPPVAVRHQAEQLRPAGRPGRRTAPPAGRTASTPRAGAGARGWSGPRPAAPGAPARCPPPAARPPRPARSSPSGCAARSSASAAGPRARWPRPDRAAGLVLDRADRGDRLVQRGGHRPGAWRRARGRSRRSARSRTRAAARRARPPGSGPAPPGWRSSSRSGAGSAAPRRPGPGRGTGCECQLVASGPVSASPSPTTQATIRSGLSNAAPCACESE